MRVPIPIVGPTYTSRSLPLSAQVTRNMYPELHKEAKSSLVLRSTPGAKLVTATGGRANRGACVYKGEYYTLCGVDLYKVNSSGVASVVGSVAGLGRAIFTEAANELMIATGGVAYYYRWGVNNHPDRDLGSPNSFAYLDRRVYSDVAGGEFRVGNLNDPLTIDSINNAEAEAAPDALKRIISHKQQLIMFGDKSIEPWYTSAGIPPVRRINNAIINSGLGAIHSVAKTEQVVFFIDEQFRPIQLNGYVMQQIGNPALLDQWETYADREEAIGVTWRWGTYDYYCVSFPSASKTWVFSVQTGSWFEMTLGMDGYRHIINDVQWVYGKHLISDYRTSTVYEWDRDTYTDAGIPIQRRRDTAVIHGGMFQAHGKKIFMQRLEVVVEFGNTTHLTGQGSNPDLMMQFSDDGGHTWSTERRASIGKMGEFQRKLVWHGLGSFYERIFRFKFTDPVELTLMSATADMEVGA